MCRRSGWNWPSQNPSGKRDTDYCYYPPPFSFFPMYFSTGFFPPADYGDAVFSPAPKFQTLPRKLRRCSLSVIPRRLLGANYDGDAVFPLSPVVCLAQITGMQSFWAGGARMLTFDLFFFIDFNIAFFFPSTYC